MGRMETAVAALYRPLTVYFPGQRRP